MTISKVAKIAGLPYSTTWRALNQAPGVSAEKAEAVRKAMRTLGHTDATPLLKRYRTTARDNGRATTSALRRRSIALLYLGENSALCVAILRTVQQILADARMNMIFAHVAGPDDIPSAVRNRQVSGILGSGEFPAAAVTDEIRMIPAVWMMTPFAETDDLWGDRVMANHRAIGRLACRYLIARGVRRMAYLSPIANCFSQQRGQAFVDSAKAAGAASVQMFTAADPEVYLFRSPAQAVTAAVTDTFEQWFASDPRPDGLFVPNDVIASIVHRLLLSRGIRPEVDVHLVSCDRRQEELSVMDPPPASIDINREKIARLAVERLLWRMRERAEIQQQLGESAAWQDANLSDVAASERRAAIRELLFPPVHILVGPTLEGY